MEFGEDLRNFKVQELGGGKIGRAREAAQGSPSTKLQTVSQNFNSFHFQFHSRFPNVKIESQFQNNVSTRHPLAFISPLSAFLLFALMLSGHSSLHQLQIHLSMFISHPVSLSASSFSSANFDHFSQSFYFSSR